MNRWLQWLFKRRANNAQAHAGVSDPALIARIQAFRQQNAQQAVLDQYNDIYLFHLQSPRAWARYGLWSAALVLVVFIGWAAWFNLDEVTSAQGKVITSSREQVVQSMEAGVVTDILVKEGQVVEAGQPLLRIDDVKIGANMQETKARIHALRASAIRLQAEVQGKPLTANAFSGIPPELIRHEMATFQARKKALEGNLASQLQNLKISQEELSITEPLAAKGLVSDIDVLRIQRAISETRGRIAEIQDKYKADASGELARIEGDLGAHSATLTGRADAFKRTVLYAPKKGTVKNIRVNTLVPGWVMTDKQLRLWVTDAGRADIARGQCLPQLVMPEHIARMALFLASDDSAMCTAQDFVVDGGWV